MHAAVATLETVLPMLPARDQDFAASLLKSARSARGLSPKQVPWVLKLLERVEAPQTKKVDIGDMKGVIDLFEKAKEKLKYPAIVLNVADQDTLVRLYPAGARATVPGSITVVDYVRTTHNDRAVYYGRILKDGTYEMSARAPKGLDTVLSKFAADPAVGAKESARLTGKCCFCHKGLKDERSTAVGYGRTCATNYGLPW